MKECIIVLGMHRSGTSVIAGLISHQGFYLGKTEMPKRHDNPKGFFENFKIYQLNQSILLDHNTSWDDHTFDISQITKLEMQRYEKKAHSIIESEFASEEHIFMKDPRMCLLFPLWEKVLSEKGYGIKVLLAYRSPVEVSHSLMSRNEISSEKSVLIWLHHFFQAEKYSRAYDRILVKYDTDISDLESFCHKLSVFLGTEYDNNIRKKSIELFSSTLNHHKQQNNELIECLPSYINDFLAELNKNREKAISKIDPIVKRFYQTQALFLHDDLIVKKRVKSLEDEVKNLKSTLKKAENEIKFKLREIDQHQIRINNAKQDYSKLTKEFARVKGTLEQLIIDKDKVIISKVDEITSKDEQLAVGDILFRKAFINKKWNKKIKRSIETNQHYKIKSIVSVFSNKSDKQLYKEKALIVGSGMFSPFYYLTKNIDVWDAGLDPLHHFCEHGWKEGRNPSRYFDCKAYLNKNTDIAKSGKNPLIHYVNYGKAEGRSSGVRIPLPNLINPSDDVPISEQPCITLRKFLACRTLPEIPPKTDEIQVSILILTRDGLDHLKILIPALYEHTQDVSYELIVVDNASTDESIKYLENCGFDFNLNIIKNTINETFSKGNNQAAEQAKGKYLLLLNNDVEPMRGWLHYLINCIESDENIGSVGARLVYPFKKTFKKSCTVQHAGIAFRDEIGFFRPYNQSNGVLVGSQNVLNNSDKSALTAACLLVRADIFKEIGGLDEAYNYGFEDVDLGLKILKTGFRNIYCAESISLHYEFGTQNKSNRDEVIERREKNADLLRSKWASSIKQKYWKEKLFDESHLIAESPLKVAIAVTDYGPKVTAGDYFTAQEITKYLEDFGWSVVYLSRVKDEWYQLDEEIDVLISLLDAYDLNQLPARKTRLHTIAWARNWFDRWCEMPCFNNYDVVFASSNKSCEYVLEHTQQEPILLPIASNTERFHETPSCNTPELYESDICFTGSYWNSPRDIMQALSNEALDKYRFSVYGANWDTFEKFKPYNKGFLAYENIPYAYHNTKIVVDDANHVTKPYGAVNSRVFDALMSGALVITNGVEGSKDLFAGELPYYETSKELDELLDFYLNNEEARQAKVKQLKSLILKEHTYKHRAETIRDALCKRFLSKSIAIKIPAPTWEGSYSWGDYHMAVLLKKQLENEGYYVLLQILPEWDNNEGLECDAVIVLRGLSRYKPKSHQINIMWNISHPDKVTLDEYEEYDKIFIASEMWADNIGKQVSVPVETMLQCTDPERFHEPSEPEKEQYKQQLLFVGNSRDIYRKVLKDLIPTNYDLAVYGKNWNKLIPKQYIKGDHIANDELFLHYGSADILLNDHWDDMREKGFVSNRIFDGLACGAFIITDKVEAMGELINYVQVYETPQELKKQLEYYMNHPEERLKMAQKGMKYVIENHAFKQRANVFSESIDLLIKARLSEN